MSWVTDINGETTSKAKGGAAMVMVVSASKIPKHQALFWNVENARGRTRIMSRSLINDTGRLCVRRGVLTLNDAEFAKLCEVNLDAALRLSRDTLVVVQKTKVPPIIDISLITACRAYECQRHSGRNVHTATCVCT